MKFDEPYLMYRDWREVTKTLLSKGPSASNVPKGRLRRAETKVYVDWVCREIRRDSAQFDGFTKGRGIIATRERFLRWMESGAGKDALREGSGGREVGVGAAGEAGAVAREEVDLTKGKVIIVPVAIPGVGEFLLFTRGSRFLSPCDICAMHETQRLTRRLSFLHASRALAGKTSVAVGLQHLFGFAHVQSDDITAKKPAPIFIKHVSQALKKHDVVIADKCVPLLLPSFPTHTGN